MLRASARGKRGRPSTSTRLAAAAAARSALGREVAGSERAPGRPCPALPRRQIRPRDLRRGMETCPTPPARASSRASSAGGRSRSQYRRQQRRLYCGRHATSRARGAHQHLPPEGAGESARRGRDPREGRAAHGPTAVLGAALGSGERPLEPHGARVSLLHDPRRVSRTIDRIDKWVLNWICPKSVSSTPQPQAPRARATAHARLSSRRRAKAGVTRPLSICCVAIAAHAVRRPGITCGYCARAGADRPRVERARRPARGPRDAIAAERSAHPDEMFWGSVPARL